MIKRLCYNPCFSGSILQDNYGQCSRSSTTDAIFVLLDRSLQLYRPAKSLKVRCYNPCFVGSVLVMENVFLSVTILVLLDQFVQGFPLLTRARSIRHFTPLIGEVSFGISIKRTNWHYLILSFVVFCLSIKLKSFTHHRWLNLHGVTLIDPPIPIIQNNMIFYFLCSVRLFLEHL